MENIRNHDQQKPRGRHWTQMLIQEAAEFGGQWGLQVSCGWVLKASKGPRDSVNSLSQNMGAGVSPRWTSPLPWPPAGSQVLLGI